MGKIGVIICLMVRIFGLSYSNVDCGCEGLGYADVPTSMGDSIPLVAVQTGYRSVQLSWPEGSGVTTVYRQYPGQSNAVEIGTTESSSWNDHHDRCVCSDTVNYSIQRGSDEGYAAVVVSDNEPTAMATWGVVTVEDERIHLRWNPSGDADIMGYLVFDGTPSELIDTVFGHESNEYSYIGDELTEIHHFRLSAFDSCLQASQITDACNNIVLHLDSDPCNSRVRASWNEYMNMPSHVGGYELWASEDGDAFRRVVQTDANTAEAVFEVGASCMALSAYVRAVSTDGTLEARSNRVGVDFATAARPAYFYLRKVSTSDDGKCVTVLAQTDPSYEVVDYRVYRSVDGGGASVVGHVTPSADGSLVWNDTKINGDEVQVSYRMGVFDGCGRNEMLTKWGSMIVPTLSTEGDGLLLSWNAYDGWSGVTEYYVVSSPLDGEGWRTEGSTSGSTYSISETDGELRRYKVLAFESSGSEYQRNDSLQSRAVFHRPHTDIWMPDAFTPLETSNNRIGPHFQYINPVGYSFTVFNRHGLIVFSTSDPELMWDGKSGGVMQPMGVYVYKITYRQNDGTDQFVTGCFTLLK